MEYQDANEIGLNQLIAMVYFSALAQIHHGFSMIGAKNEILDERLLRKRHGDPLLPFLN